MGEINNINTEPASSGCREEAWPDRWPSGKVCKAASRKKIKKKKHRFLAPQQRSLFFLSLSNGSEIRIMENNFFITFPYSGAACPPFSSAPVGTVTWDRHKATSLFCPSSFSHPSRWTSILELSIHVSQDTGSEAEKWIANSHSEKPSWSLLRAPVYFLSASYVHHFIPNKCSDSSSLMFLCEHPQSFFLQALSYSQSSVKNL